MSALRPAIHAAMGLFAFALGVLPRWAAIGMALAAIVFNWVLLPRLALGRRLQRPGEPFLGGLRTYPVAVLGLVVFLPPAEAAAAWIVMAWGDAAAALVGQTVPAPRVFGHRKATWSGTCALFLVGATGAWLAGQFVVLSAPARETDIILGVAKVLGGPGEAPSLARCVLAALAATLVDLVRIPPDDNLPCAAVSGAVLRALRSVV